MGGTNYNRQNYLYTHTTENGLSSSYCPCFFLFSVVTSIFITLPKLLQTSTMYYNFGNEEFYFPSESVNRKLNIIKKLSCYMPWRHMGERRYSSYSYLTLALDGGKWSASCPGCTFPQYPLARRLGGPQSWSECRD
jgi:hypothetical protein